MKLSTSSIRKRNYLNFIRINTMPRQSCAVCAWREKCSKRFRVSDGGARCPDFSRDVSIKDADEYTQTDTKKAPWK